MEFHPNFYFTQKTKTTFLLFSGLNQNSLPGTPVEEFWADGDLSLNQWSHLVLTYSQENRRARFYIDGKFEGETSFSNNQVFPIARSFRLGPKDGNQSIVTDGKIDDFRVYKVELSASEIARLYGNDG